MKKEIHPAVRRICEYIDLHLTEDLSYRQLKEHLQLSQHDLTDRFPKYTGFTLTNYIIHRRLELVISKVLKGSRLETAVYRSGFNTYSHFYKEFRTHYGTAPRDYFTVLRNKNSNKKTTTR